MQSNLEIIKSNYEAQHKLFENLAPNIEWQEMPGFPYGGTYHGPQQLLDGVFSKIDRDWENFRAVADTFLESGEHVVTLGHYGGVFKRTGKTVRAAFAHVYTLRDGKIVKFRQFADSALFAQAMR